MTLKLILLLLLAIACSLASGDRQDGPLVGDIWRDLTFITPPTVSLKCSVMTESVPRYCCFTISGQLVPSAPQYLGNSSLASILSRVYAQPKEDPVIERLYLRSNSSSCGLQSPRGILVENGNSADSGILPFLIEEELQKGTSSSFNMTKLCSTPEECRNHTPFRHVPVHRTLLLDGIIDKQHNNHPSWIPHQGIQGSFPMLRFWPIDETGIKSLTAGITKQLSYLIHHQSYDQSDMFKPSDLDEIKLIMRYEGTYSK